MKVSLMILRNLEHPSTVYRYCQQELPVLLQLGRSGGVYAGELLYCQSVLNLHDYNNFRI